MGARIARRSCCISQNSPLHAHCANTDHTRVAVPNGEARPGGGRSTRVCMEGTRQPRPGCTVDGARGPAAAPNQLLGIAILTAASTELGTDHTRVTVPTERPDPVAAAAPGCARRAPDSPDPVAPSTTPGSHTRSQPALGNRHPHRR
jgi:hypothetical protein